MHKDLPPGLAARLGPPINSPSQDDRGQRYGDRQGGGRGGRNGGGGGGTVARDLARLRGVIRSQKDEVAALTSEVSHYQSRLQRVEEGHRLELARLKKEVTYHKRLRQGADQRSYELQAQLQQQQSAAPQHSEEHSTLIEQSQILISKNSELTYKLKTLEGQVQQLEELKSALENELQQVYWERDAMASELEQVLSRHQHSLEDVPEDEEGYGEGEVYSETNNEAVAATGEASPES